MSDKSKFELMYEIDCSKHVKKKDKFNYLSWTYAWKEMKKNYPTVTYKVLRFENGLPYTFDENTGYMVFTEVTVDDITHPMWLPVLNGANKAMKNKAYTYDTKYKKGVEVLPATMMDLNTTIMRCLTKNLAMFGIGLYIYAGEDIPEKEIKLLTEEQIMNIREVDQKGVLSSICKNINNVERSSYESLLNLVKEGQ